MGKGVANVTYKELGYALYMTRRFTVEIEHKGVAYRLSRRQGAESGATLAYASFCDLLRRPQNNHFLDENAIQSCVSELCPGNTCGTCSNKMTERLCKR